MLPCNRFAIANVTWCGPGVELGSNIFNISFDGFNESFESTTIQCTTESKQQIIGVCYPLYNPGDFQVSPCFVVFKDPHTTDTLIISGALMLACGLVLTWLVDREEKRVQMRDQLRDTLFPDALIGC